MDETTSKAIVPVSKGASFTPDQASDVAAAPIQLKVERCARCGDTHPKVLFIPFVSAPEYATHWGYCPASAEPIMMRARVRTEADAADKTTSKAELLKENAALRAVLVEVKALFKAELGYEPLYTQVEKCAECGMAITHVLVPGAASRPVCGCEWRGL